MTCLAAAFITSYAHKQFYVLRPTPCLFYTSNHPTFRLPFPPPVIFHLQLFETVHVTVDVLTSSRSGTYKRVYVPELTEAVLSDKEPHPAGQKQKNVPFTIEEAIPGMHHKIQRKDSISPTEGQHLHLFCIYCFRRVQRSQQIDPNSSLLRKTSSNCIDTFAKTSKSRTYRLRAVIRMDLFRCNGQPKCDQLAKYSYVERLLQDRECRNLTTNGIGTKILAFWPYTYAKDPYAENWLRLCEEPFSSFSSGKDLSIMAHIPTPIELSAPIVLEAIGWIRSVRAQERCQGQVGKT